MSYNKTEIIEKYLYDFFSSRYKTIDHFYRDVQIGKQTGIYQLRSGTELMVFFDNIHGNIEEGFFADKLIPQSFPTLDALMRALNSFKSLVESGQHLLDINQNGENTSYIIRDLQHLKNELVEAIEYTNQLYDNHDTFVPYQEIRYKLISNDVDGFIDLLKSILASVSYAIAKIQEGYFHSNVHLILKLLGFDVLSEEMTSNGRIDAVIRFSNKIYIVEFKFDESADLSQEALTQIIAKEYHLKFLVEGKDIYGIGISFSKQTRNINAFKFQKLN